MPSPTEAEVNARILNGRIKNIDARDGPGRLQPTSKTSAWALCYVSSDRSMVCGLLASTTPAWTISSWGLALWVLACDEASEVNMASWAIILTTFPDFLCLLLFGDPNQLRPYEIARIFNKFRENAGLSVLGLLQLKEYHIIRLDIQYRIATAIYIKCSLFLSSTKASLATTALRSRTTRIGRSLERSPGMTTA